MSKKLLALSLAVVCPLISHAEESSPWKLFALGGLSFGNGTSYTTKASDGTVLSDRNESDKSALLVGGELQYRWPSVFSLSLAIESNKYVYQDGTPSDSQLAFFIVPAAHKQFDRWDIWGGLGLGVSILSLGQSSASAGGLRASFDSGSSTQLAISPRVGVDYSLSEAISLGLQLEYRTYSGTYTGSIVDSTGKSARFSEDFGRSNWGSALRLGLTF